MAQNKLKVGVVGVGYLGQHHARIYSTLESVQLVGVYDINTDRANEIAALYNTKAYPSAKSLAEAAEAISVVVPTDKHAQVARELLAEDVHLLVEKPFCSNLTEAQEIAAIARDRGKIIQVGHVEQYNPIMHYLETQVSDPRFITADRLAPFNPRGSEVGVVLDLMIHDIGVLLRLVHSPVKKVEAVGVRVLSNSEDIANARITFENGAIANLNTSRVSLKKVREIRVFQDSKYISLDFMNQSGHVIIKSAGSLVKEEVPIEKGEPLKIELQSFIDCIQKSTTPRVDATAGLNALEIALEITDQIQRSFSRENASQSTLSS